MKIKVTEKSYAEVMQLPRMKHKDPVPQSAFFRGLVRLLVKSELKKVRFSAEKKNMEGLEKTPCLYLMNHSSFIDLKIAFTLIGRKPFHIVCTSDGFVGKEWLMRMLGCIPTWKFTTDISLVKDMRYVSSKLKSSILMYPEASYTFDGTETPLPDSLGKCIKLLKVPVVMIRTEGAFLRDPLYNGLRLRDVEVSAVEECILTAEDVQKKTADEINSILIRSFTYDHFKTQQEKGIRVCENFRAEGLERALYKCPHCLKEGTMRGHGTKISCTSCGEAYELTETGFLAHEGHPAAGKFSHIPDWYRWERECVKQELLAHEYRISLPVTICMMVDMKSIYRVGKGILTLSEEGMDLTGCEEKLHYHQSPKSSYSLYSDFFWYEIGDMICIGDTRALYYCFPETENVPVAKARLAAEELYKLS